MKVEKMISWTEAEKKKENNLDGDYYISLLVYLKENNLKFTGEDHQAENFNGVPLFEDDTVALCSWRYWGDIMSQIWGGDYMDWYMNSTNKRFLDSQKGE